MSEKLPAGIEAKVRELAEYLCAHISSPSQYDSCIKFRMECIRPVALEAYAAGGRAGRLKEFRVIKKERPIDPIYWDMHHEKELVEAVHASLSQPSQPPSAAPSLTDRCLAVIAGNRCSGIPTSGQVLCLEHHRMRDAKQDFDIAIVPIEEFRAATAPPVEVPGKEPAEWREPPLCEHCGYAIKIRNPSGYCDHLYYPDMCKICEKRIESEG